MGLISFVEDTEPSHLEQKLQWNKKPVTATSELKKVEKKKTISVPKNDEGVVSLKFEEVNDNADELIELRGAGRYFGVTDPSTGESINAQQELGRLCDNCHERGHIRAKCKIVICHKCGVVGDHYETQCPTTIICSRCGERGHTWSVCTSKKWKQQYCKCCDSSSHSDDTCPSIWRSYLTKACASDLKLPVSYCYNCGDDTHYGDECSKSRTSRIPNSSGSAFSGNNLPQELRDEYFDTCFGKKRGAQEISSKKSSSYPSCKDYGSSYENTQSNFSNSYGNGYNSHGRSYNGSGYYGNSSGGSKRKSSSNTPSESLRNYEPSRSGFISLKTNGKKPSNPNSSLKASKTGVLPSIPKGPGGGYSGVTPSRSGVLSRGKKQGRKHVKEMY